MDSRCRRGEGGEDGDARRGEQRGGKEREQMRSRSRKLICESAAGIVGLSLLCFVCVSEGAGVVRYWTCTPDGSLSIEDIESQSCAFVEKNVNSPCQSCISSLQSGTTSSGLLIPTNQFKCMQKQFKIDPEPASASPPLCAGTYTVKSCETQTAVFEQRIAAIQKVLDATRQDPKATCFDANGVRKLEARCTSGFPKDVQIEFAASLEFDSFLVAGRNPASYRKRFINDCPELIDYLTNLLVGCVSVSAVGLVSPVSPETWCQTITWNPYGNVYHPVNAQLPNDATNAGLSGQNAGGAGIVPIGTDLGYSQ